MNPHDPEEPLSGAAHEPCGADVAAYALGALDSAEAEAMRRHLETCAVCPVELAAFRQVVDDLALAAPQLSAPRGLRRRVMQAVAEETQAPGTADRAPASPRRPARRRRWAALPRPAFAISGAVGLAAAAAAVIVFALSGGGTTRRIQATVVGGNGHASLTVAPDGHAELVLHHVAPPPRGKIYEVWLQRGTEAPSPTNALFSVNHDGDASVDVPGSLHGVRRVMVTPEPAGGSRVPTHPPVITATL
jgi:hypothetical protein